MDWRETLYAISIYILLSAFAGLFLFLCARAVSKRFDAHVARHEITYAIVCTAVLLIAFIFGVIGGKINNSYTDQIHEECVERHVSYPEEYNVCPICGDSLN